MRSRRLLASCAKAREKKKKRRGEFVLAPIPMHSPAIGAGLELGLGYIFQLDPDNKVSPPSAVGAGGFFTSNGSHGVGEAF